MSICRFQLAEEFRMFEPEPSSLDGANIELAEVFESAEGCGSREDAAQEHTLEAWSRLEALKLLSQHQCSTGMPRS